MPGLPKKYAKMGFKKGWRAFKASKSKSSKGRSKSRSSTINNPTRRSRVKSFLNFSRIKSWIQKIALIAPAAFTAIGPGSPQEKILQGVRKYTGYNLSNGSWNVANLLEGWAPFIGAVAATEGISLLKRVIKGMG